MQTVQEKLVYKVATEEWEFNQIHRLNYQTFVEEIPQHSRNQDGVLVDKFHDQNTYFVCLRGKYLQGMLAVKAKRPFSLDAKLVDLDSYLPPGRSVCEVRLLSLAKEARGSRVFPGLMNYVLEYCIDIGIDFMLISATVRQLKLYRHLGFVPFGPLVGSDEAPFQPMYLSKEAFSNKASRFIKLIKKPEVLAKPVSFLPGPVNIAEAVRQSFADAPVSHRSEQFCMDFKHIKMMLCRMVKAQKVEILLGSGTLANDVIAAQLKLTGERGLVLSNGEFGERLIDHAKRAGLEFEVLRNEWGACIDYEAIKSLINCDKGIYWLWTVHCETSTGVLNDLQLLQTITKDNDIKLCLDCISSVGSVPLDLSQVYLASGVSGKAVGSYPGLSLVFYNHEVQENSGLPRYLDLGGYAAQGGIAYTHSSNLIYSLRTALVSMNVHERSEATAKDSARVRARMQEAGCELVGRCESSSPAVLTVNLPSGISSKTIGEQLEAEGFLLSYRSAYLLERNWLQICLMGEYRRDLLEPLVERIIGLLR